MIRKQGGKYVVLSEDGSKKLGSYDTAKQAKTRLAQVEMFKSLKASGKLRNK